MSVIERLRRKFRSFATHEDGVSAMEFALVFPILISVVFLSSGTFDALQAKQRAAKTVDALADIASRTVVMDDDQRDTFFDAAILMLGRHAEGAELDIVLTGIEYNQANDVMVVAWSESFNDGIALERDDELPAEDFPGIMDGEMLVIATFELTYDSPFFGITGQQFTFRQQATRKPRFINTIDYDEPRYD